MKRVLVLLMIAIIISSQSCVSHKDLLGFQVQEDEAFSYSEEIANNLELLIQPFDLLKIDVFSANEEVVKQFRLEQTTQNNLNLNQAGNTMGNNLELFTGFMVDKDGYIDFPTLGRVKAEGLTTEVIQAQLQEQIKVYVRDGVVNVRLLNFKVTVLGEVNQPGVVRLTNKRVTVLEAIGFAGDFSPYANRRNVLLVREKEEQREYIELDLSSREVFKSPYFYLKQNDAIYVEPVKAKTATVADPLTRALSFGSAFVSIITLVIAIVR